MLKIIFIFTTIFFAFLHSHIFAQIPDIERQALIDLYQATDGDNWHRNEGWLEHPDVCEWQGIRCQATNDDHLRLSLLLSKNNLKGEIPASITDLRHLNYLRLDGNRLEGELPASLVNELRTSERGFVELIVDLSDNQLSGTLPDFISDEVEGLRYPTTFNLSRNRFSGQLPASWSQVPWYTLNLGGNQLTGPVPDEWAGSGLRVLRLSGNQFEGEPPPVLAEMPELRVLDLANNHFSGPLPAWFGQLELEQLLLQGNHLSGPLDPAVQAMRTDMVVELMVADNQFSGTIPSALAELRFRPIENEHLTQNAALPGLDLCWNELESPDGALLDFLNLHNHGADVSSCLDGAQRSELDPTISGTWFDPGRSGEGVVQQLLPGGNMFIYWFSYSPHPGETGRQFWAFEAVEVDDSHARFEPVYAPEGGRFSHGLGNQSVEFDPLWTGRIFIDRLGTGLQQMRYSQLAATPCPGSLCPGRAFGHIFSGTIEQVQLTRLAGTTCDNQQPHQDISAIWLSPHSNEGFVVEVIENGQGVVYWFTYEPDGSGRQAWMTGVGEFHGTTLQIDDLVQPVGGRFGANFDPAEVEHLHWGSLTLEFDDFWHGQAAWDSVREGYGEGHYPIRRLTVPMLAECE